MANVLPDPDPPAQRVRGEELRRRIELVRTQLLSGKSRRWVAKLVAQEWGLKSSQCWAYVRKAERKIREVVDRDKGLWLAEHIALRRDIRRRANDQNDLRMELAAAESDARGRSPARTGRPRRPSGRPRARTRRRSARAGAFVVPSGYPGEVAAVREDAAGGLSIAVRRTDVGVDPGRPNGLGLTRTTLETWLAKFDGVCGAKAMAADPEVKPLGEHGGVRGQVDNGNLTKGGNTSAYLVARLKRDHPEIAAARARGESLTPRAVAS